VLLDSDDIDDAVVIVTVGDDSPSVADTLTLQVDIAVAVVVVLVVIDADTAELAEMWSN